MVALLLLVLLLPLLPLPVGDVLFLLRVLFCWCYHPAPFVTISSSSTATKEYINTDPQSGVGSCRWRGWWLLWEVLSPTSDFSTPCPFLSPPEQCCGLALAVHNQQP